MCSGELVNAWHVYQILQSERRRSVTIEYGDTDCAAVRYYVNTTVVYYINTAVRYHIDTAVVYHINTTVGCHSTGYSVPGK